MSEHLTETIRAPWNGACRRCDGDGYEGFFGAPATCPRCNGTGADPSPEKPYTRTVAWTGNTEAKP